MFDATNRLLNPEMSTMILHCTTIESFCRDLFRVGIRAQVSSRGREMLVQQGFSLATTDYLYQLQPLRG